MSDDSAVLSPCPSWCVDRDYEATPDHPESHAGALFGVGAWGGNRTAVTVFVQPVRIARTSEPAADVVAFAIGDEPAMFSVEPGGARSLAAALTRMADQLEHE